MYVAVLLGFYIGSCRSIQRIMPDPSIVNHLAISRESEGPVL